MFERKRSKRLDSISTLRSVRPGGNSRNFTDMQPDLGQRAFQPSKLGCVDDADWKVNGGNATAKVDPL